MHIFYLILILVVLRIVTYWLFSGSGNDEGVMSTIKGVGRFLFWVLAVLATAFLLGFGAVIYRIIKGEFPI